MTDSRFTRSSAQILASIALTLCMALSAPVAHSQGAAQRTATSAESVGISSERLKRVDALFDRYVADKKIAGAVALIMRDGRVVHLKAYGKQDVDKNVPMSTDSIFRIASMSKAVTTAAAMILVEQGDLLLSDPVSKYLPAYKQTFVAVPPPPGAPQGTPLGSVPANRAITIRDLMTQTAGISYGTGPLTKQYRDAGFDSWYCADRNETIGQAMDRLATLPFTAQPGEAWVYGFGTDILGRVVEVASGMPLDRFFQERIFAPLGMRDSYFYLPAEKASRLATVYGLQENGMLTRVPEAGRTGQGEYVNGPRKCFSGGAGLVSTAPDYGRFLQMLLNGGELDGARVLSPASIASMTANQVGDLYLRGDLGFGLGFEVIEHVGRAGRLGAQGEFGWSSAYYPRFWVDPANGVVALFMTQLMPSRNLDLQPKFRSVVYQAIEVPGRDHAPLVTSGAKSR